MNRYRHCLPFVGIDDFAFKKRESYGTIFIDLQTKTPLDLIPTRTQPEVTKWLKKHPEIKLISRDGSKTYAKAASNASPHMLQVGDRWHILHQLFDAVKKEIFAIVPERWTTILSDSLPTPKETLNHSFRKNERIREENEQKRWTRIQKVHSLKEQGYKITAIVNHLNISRGTVYADLKVKQKPNHKRSSPFDHFRPFIQSLIQKNQTVE
ncbi:transposase [Aneurinibacillus sp. Ricciae_BoGa-3]|uniref:transposase n=1 Tax=Aneurinibacillus sp. Ricciae_BoGa-3 TaxID=3022697 RepID=UPI00234208F8|nr:transposase [Aneurinibacillus sp. Ricciae_BoGa-3]WCK52516.1 transposase [Aneurinibacillus sp. Ricciae_BoGa-3]